MTEKKDNRARLEELIGSDSTNFFGTGLTLREFLVLTQAEKLVNSWCLQTPEEQKRHRRIVIQLSQELGRIQEKTGSGTRLAELAIESVIEGDWKMVEEWAEHFSFEEDDEQICAQSAEPYSVFRELLLQALRTNKEPPA
jgi:hypothetical protein